MKIKIQRKLLSDEQKQQICKQHEHCKGCPLSTDPLTQQLALSGFYCIDQSESVLEAIQNFWNEEIVIDDEIFKTKQIEPSCETCSYFVDDDCIVYRNLTERIPCGFYSTRKDK